MDKASIKKKAAELGVGDVEGKTIKVLARECVMRAGKFETFLGGGGGYFYVLEFRLLVSEEEMVGFLGFLLASLENAGFSLGFLLLSLSSCSMFLTWLFAALSFAFHFCSLFTSRFFL